MFYQYHFTQVKVVTVVRNNENNPPKDFSIFFRLKALERNKRLKLYEIE